MKVPGVLILPLGQDLVLIGRLGTKRNISQLQTDERMKEVIKKAQIRDIRVRLRVRPVYTPHAVSFKWHSSAASVDYD